MAQAKREPRQAPQPGLWATPFTTVWLPVMRRGEQARKPAAGTGRGR